MVLEPSYRTLFIFAGQRDDKYLSDMYAFDLNTNTATELYSNFTAAGGPDACFTQRAVIDSNLRELYVYVLSISTMELLTRPFVQVLWAYAKSPSWLSNYSRIRGTQLGVPI